ncbi:unknown [Prevotella sp. CAG:924]|nr:unknown [Prevotella sp. CAG:924]
MSLERFSFTITWSKPEIPSDLRQIQIVDVRFGSTGISFILTVASSCPFLYDLMTPSTTPGMSISLVVVSLIWGLYRSTTTLPPCRKSGMPLTVMSPRSDREISGLNLPVAASTIKLPISIVLLILWLEVLPERSMAAEALICILPSILIFPFLSDSVP